MARLGRSRESPRADGRSRSSERRKRFLRLRGSSCSGRYEGVHLPATCVGLSDRAKNGSKKIEGATASRPLRPLLIVPLSFLGSPAQSVRETRPGRFSWQEESKSLAV